MSQFSLRGPVSPVYFPLDTFHWVNLPPPPSALVHFLYFQTYLSIFQILIFSFVPFFSVPNSYSSLYVAYFPKANPNGSSSTLFSLCFIGIGSTRSLCLLVSPFYHPHQRSYRFFALLETNQQRHGQPPTAIYWSSWRRLCLALSLRRRCWRSCCCISWPLLSVTFVACVLFCKLTFLPPSSSRTADPEVAGKR